MRQHLQPAIDHYHALIANDLTAAENQLEQLRTQQHERRALFGGRPMAHSLRPTFLTEAMYADVQDTVYLIRQAILRIASVFFNDETLLREELGMEPWEIELAAIPTRVIHLAANARLDAFLTERSFKFVEFNGESPAGMAYVNELAKIYQDLPLFQTFTEQFPVRFVSPLQHAMQAFLRIYHDEFGGQELQPTFAIVDRLEDVPTTHEFDLIKTYLQRLGYGCVVIDPRELDCRNGWIYANGTKIDILYRRLLMNEFYEIRDDCQPYLEGYRAQKTCYLNTFRAKLVHKKAIFSFLTDEQYTKVLEAPQRQAIQQHIPWTRRLRPRTTEFRGLTIDLLDFARQNQRYFVIKPNDAYGGSGVTLGFASTPSEWDAAIEEGVEAGHVIQETVDIHREPFLMQTDNGWEQVPSIIDLDPYINGPLMGGCLTRISGSDLANVTAGGGTLPMFILRNTYHANS
ncbi:hypothetical protein CRI93_13215 [Longimonas halophila]|uniref:Circularly permuted ATPgrasp domain-containing protein n=1 Tax=Longimonas halophila TaxID=1469170 RepID=A0A2H3NQI8_9BACT|nr:hypothetical protein [Longimonas halophila]PEN05467.1 hypothetical protein CRI93_13215 [Longimonas halophila]